MPSFHSRCCGKISQQRATQERKLCFSPQFQAIDHQREVRTTEFKTVPVRAGQMAQRLKAQTALAEDLNLAPGTLIGSVTQSPWPLGSELTGAHTPTQTRQIKSSESHVMKSTGCSSEDLGSIPTRHMAAHNCP